MISIMMMAMLFCATVAAAASVAIAAIAPDGGALPVLAVGANKLPGTNAHAFDAPLINFAEKIVFVTGGTGSFGKAFVRSVLRRYPDLKAVVIYSRDELKQYDMQIALSKAFGRERVRAHVRFVIGDVRDLPALSMAMIGADFVVHAAASHSEIAEASGTLPPRGSRMIAESPHPGR